MSTNITSSSADPFLQEAFAEARRGFDEGGLPIGSVLVHDGVIIARGRNRRVQDGSPIQHAEINCFQNAGRIPAAVYQDCTIYSTLSPCYMCSGAMLLFGVPRVVIGESRTVEAADGFLRSHGVEVSVLDDQGCFDLLQAFTSAHPEIWAEDIGDAGLNRHGVKIPGFNVQ